MLLLASIRTSLEIKLEHSAFTWEDVERAISIIAYNINLNSFDKFDFILAPSRGGLIPATMLSHKLNIPVYPVWWSTRDHVDRIINEVPNQFVNLVSLNGRDNSILIVEDIIDSGATVRDIIVGINNRLGYCVNKVKAATIVNNHDQNIAQVDYFGYSYWKNKKEIWFEFPWENN